MRSPVAASMMLAFGFASTYSGCLSSDPPARYIQGCSLERLDPGLALIAKDAELDPSARFEAIGSQRGGGQINKPVMAHPNSRVIRLLDKQVVTSCGRREDLADPVGDDTNRFVFWKGEEAFTTPAGDVRCDLGRVGE